MSGLVCAFGERMGSFEGNYLDLLFKHQDIGVGIFTCLFNFSYSSFKLGQNNNINLSVSFPLKIFFSEQQILKR